MALIFVTGGAKSGKSKFAEELILSLNNGKQENVYLATSLVFDEEMKEKVRLHKKRRKDEWFTVEAYKNFENELNNFFENIKILSGAQLKSIAFISMLIDQLFSIQF